MEFIEVKNTERALSGQQRIDLDASGKEAVGRMFDELKSNLQFHAWGEKCPNVPDQVLLALLKNDFALDTEKQIRGARFIKDAQQDQRALIEYETVMKEQFLDRMVVVSAHLISEVGNDNAFLKTEMLALQQRLLSHEFDVEDNS